MNAFSARGWFLPATTLSGEVSMNVAVTRDGVDAKGSESDGLTLIACPTSQNETTEREFNQVGRYNALHLAGQALSLAESLSPSYMQVYVNSLEDFSALKELGNKKKR